MPAFVAALFLASCEKDPDMDKLDNDYLVYTNYDEGTDFGKFNTYYVIDSILIIGNNEKTEYWKNENSKKIINAYADRLEAAGYTRVGHTKDAEIVLQLSYISATYYFNLRNLLSKVLTSKVLSMLSAQLRSILMAQS